MASKGKKILLALTLITVLVVLAVAVAEAQKALTPLKVGVLPIMDVLPLFSAIENGYFDAEGIKLEFEPFRSGATIIEALAGRSIQVGFGNVVTFIVSKERGFGFVIITDDAYIARLSAVMARTDSGIDRLRDLGGKTIAVPGIKQIGWLYIRELVSKDGGDPARLNWLEIAFPNMAVALINRQVDAAEMVEPFVTVAREKHPELKVLSYYLYDLNPGGILANYFASEKWINENSALVERFARAHKKGVEFVTGNTDRARGILPKYTGVTPDLAKKVPLGTWRNRVDLENLQWTADLMLKHGLISKRQNAQEMVFKTAR